MTETISNLVTNFISLIFGIFKDVDLSPINDALETLTPYIKGALYLLPANTIAQIFAITCVMFSLRITIKSILLIWDLLPIA